ncbi:unnamed protein product [Blepharisma stoltei]|uniref:Uncharacterized protein n=1 Tax=Blepharisma stoltei TaxID=1481888 RepID=A0AAU9JU79_9CILI|nr:unnamed protein product [Blepharisma stoltei]
MHNELESLKELLLQDSWDYTTEPELIDRNSCNRGSLSATLRASKILLFDINSKNCYLLNLDDIYDQKNILHDKDNSYALIFQGLDEQEVKEIRKFFGLHPVIDYECASNHFNNKDHMLDFHDYYLLTINDASIEGDVENPVSMKTIIRKNLILIFCEERVYCIRQLFYKELNIIDFENREFENYIWDYNIACRKTEINEKCGCSAVEAIFHRLIEWIFARLEKIASNMNIEARCCLDFATGKMKIGERFGFITRLSKAERHMQCLIDLIKPKCKVFDSLLKSLNTSKSLKYYIKSLKTRAEVLDRKIVHSHTILLKSEKIFNATIEDTQNETADKLLKIMNLFSGIATIYFPANHIPGTMGMNIPIPFKEWDSFIPYICCWGLIALISINFTIIFRCKGWF